MPAPITNFRREMDRLFDDVFVGRPQTTAHVPAAAREDATGFSLELDITGVPIADVEVLAEDGVLTVRGSRTRAPLAEGERQVLGELPQGTFARQFRLPKTADLQTIQASYALGVLSIRIAKLAPAQPRRVPVSAHTPDVTPPAREATPQG